MLILLPSTKGIPTKVVKCWDGMLVVIEVNTLVLLKHSCGLHENPSYTHMVFYAFINQAQIVESCIRIYLVKELTYPCKLLHGRHIVKCEKCHLDNPSHGRTPEFCLLDYCNSTCNFNLNKEMNVHYHTHGICALHWTLFEQGCPKN